MTGATAATGQEPATAGTLTIRITTAGVSDTEVAAITVALLATTATGGPSAIADRPPAWRQAGMLEAATERRVRTQAQLRHPG